MTCHAFCLTCHAAELKLRAERRLGELLAEMPKNNGRPLSHDVTRLADLGIGRMDSSRWQKLAGIDEERFEEHIEQGRLSGELTTAGARETKTAGHYPGMIVAGCCCSRPSRQTVAGN